MKICVAVGSLLENDAIGNDVAHQLSVLNTNNISAFVYTDQVKRAGTAQYVLDMVALSDLIDDPDNILIYHHGGCWGNGQNILEKARCRIFLKYHNITPPEFFKPYTRFFKKYSNHEKFCRKGIEQTNKILRLNKVSRFLCDSCFNAKDFLNCGIDDSKIKIVPPFHKLDDFKNVEINPDLCQKLDDGKINVLFVGRLVPNKGHKHLIRVIADYTKMYNSDIRLIIVGGIDPNLRLYLDELNTLIKKNKLQEIVHIKGSVTFEELHTYYKACHIFLLMSGHEGFCLPVLEAQFHSLPIVALNTSAVPETMGENQIVFDEPDGQKFAAAIHVLYHNSDFREYIANEGKKNIERFSNKTIEDKFLKAVLD
ncbi:glycosyltransferase [Desulfobacula toluolica]|uniref:Putative glycosyl transferase, family 1 n=1 Tax=Desulfobacula toluolica (strain DSM 7467 / Tol2) TaxID=651182 RepID=K0NER8_DESTT|nr:glycosyltransferase [Desulfobacula toluolica]CCK79576.1 putative glycosyl transferase, family 1 [Desulfobacula toluolica Tol2]